MGSFLNAMNGLALAQLEPMKIIAVHKLSEGQTGFELNKFPTKWEEREFLKWAKDVGAYPYVKFDPYYIAGAIGDVDYPAIQLAKRAPKKYKMLIMLRWM
jgi:hypothetical protein